MWQEFEDRILWKKIIFFTVFFKVTCSGYEPSYIILVKLKGSAENQGFVNQHCVVFNYFYVFYKVEYW